MFWKNVKNILVNSPLVLSDTKDPADVSLNRVITLSTAVILALAPPIVLIFYPAAWSKLMDLWPKGLAFLAAQTAGNVFTKITKIKGDFECQNFSRKPSWPVNAEGAPERSTSARE